MDAFSLQQQQKVNYFIQQVLGGLLSKKKNILEKVTIIWT